MPVDYCQRCKLPLVIDTSLIGLSKAQAGLLTAGRIGYGREDKPDDVAIGQDPYIAQDRLELLNKASSNTDGPILRKSLYETSDSFVILPQFEGSSDDNNDDNDYDGDDGLNKTISNRMTSLSKIFSVLSSKNELDYPVCKDCAQLLLNGLKAQYEKTSRERDVYIQFLEKLKNKKAPLASRTEESIKEADKLKKEEEELLEELKTLELEKSSLDNEVTQVENELELLQNEQELYFTEENIRDLKIKTFMEERDTISSELEFNMTQLDKLRKTNIYSDTFNISHEGPFGTINGLRLGSLDSCRVPWQEINAALGYIVLLLATVSNRLNFKLSGYNLRPMGSTSKIEKVERDLSNSGKAKVIVMELYSSGEYQIERLFNHSKLDNAMVALLEIVSQLSDKFKELDSSIDLPYKMVKDNIGGASIKLSSKTADEEWTSACKFLLTNIKWILAYSSAHISSRR